MLAEEQAFDKELKERFYDSPRHDAEGGTYITYMDSMAKSIGFFIYLLLLFLSSPCLPLLPSCVVVPKSIVMGTGKKLKKKNLGESLHTTTANNTHEIGPKYPFPQKSLHNCVPVFGEQK